MKHGLVGSENSKMQKRVLSVFCAGALGLLLASPVFAQAPPNRVGPAAGAADQLDKVMQPVTDWLERANREYQDNVVRELSVPTGKGGGLEASKAPPVPGREPTLLDQVKEMLGIVTAKTPVADPAAVAEAAQREEALKRQMEARQLEQERNAQQQRAAEQLRLAAEATKAAEVADLTTKQNQKAAEAARLADDERRKTAGKSSVAAKTAEADAAKADEKAAAERKAVAAAEKAAVEKAEAARKAVAVAEKVAADKAAAEKVAAEKAAVETAAAERKALAAAAKAEAERKAEMAAVERKAVAFLQEKKRQQDEAALKDQRKKDQEAAKAAKKAVQAAVAGTDAAAATAKSGKGPAARRLDQTSGTTGNGAEREVKRVKTASKDGGYDKRSGKGGRCAGAGRAVELPAIYVVKRGDTLWDISRRYYDKGVRFEKIVKANQDKIDSPDLIYPCQKFFLPGRSALYWVLPLETLGAS